jgi:hypothetical protein
MSIEFQNGFLMGLLLQSKFKSSDAPSPVTLYNGAGVYWNTYIVIVFDLPLADIMPEENIDAFFITGKELGTEINYAVSGVELLDPYRLGVKCDDFKNVDDYLNISYISELGNLQGLKGDLVQTFVRQFAPQYMLPKVNVNQPYEISLSIRQTVTLPAMAESLSVDTQEPIPIGLSDTLNISINVSITVNLPIFMEDIDLT